MKKKPIPLNENIPAQESLSCQPLCRMSCLGMYPTLLSYGLCLVAAANIRSIYDMCVVFVGNKRRLTSSAWCCLPGGIRSSDPRRLIGCFLVSLYSSALTFGCVQYISPRDGVRELPVRELAAG